MLPIIAAGLWLSLSTLQYCVLGQYTPNFRYNPTAWTKDYVQPGKPNFSVHTLDINLLETDKQLAMCKNINLREITIVELQNALIRQEITSLELVRCYTRRIQAMDPHLRSVLEINPEAELIARKLDYSRAHGRYHGPLHGIPILVKDNMGTGDQMETTAGSVALLGIKPKEDSDVVKRLRMAGAVIIGKANLSEFANFRGENMPNGWSGRGNQTRNCYVLTADSSGSSSGSAVATAANLVPASLGSETDGSIVSPASAASLVGLKTTLGRISTKGVIPLASSQDVVGPITRTVADAAILFSVLSKNGFQDKCYDMFTILSKCSDKKFKIGVLREPNWNLKADAAEQLPRLEEILKVFPKIGVTVLDPIVASNGSISIITGFSEEIILLHEFKTEINDYLQNAVIENEVKVDGQVKRIKTLEDIIEFNKKFPPPEGYDQKILIKAQATDGIQNTTHIAERVKNKLGAQIYVNYMFQKYSLDAIVVPTNHSSPIPSIAGYPHITVPAGFDSRNIPFGISLYGLPDSDENLLILGYKLETYLGARKPSMFLP